MMEHYKRIVSRVVRREEHGRSINWWVVEVTTVTLECGHTKTYRGFSAAPKHRALCHECRSAAKTGGNPDV